MYLLLAFIYLCYRFCVCMLHEQLVRYLKAHKHFLVHHSYNCTCECAFCDTCKEIHCFNISQFMRHMLCTPLLCFPGSSTSLYSWECIENREGSHNSNFYRPICSNLASTIPKSYFCSRCLNCNENQTGTIVECPSSNLLGDIDKIKFEVYSEVDLTRQSLSACATGTAMKVHHLYCFPYYILW